MVCACVQASIAISEDETLEDDIVLLDQAVPADKIEIEEYAKSLSWRLSRPDQRNAPPPPPPSSTTTSDITYHRRITFSTVRAVDLRQVEILCESVRARSLLFLFFPFLSETDTNNKRRHHAQVGWPRRPFKKLRIALANSYLLASLASTSYYRDELGRENQVGETVLVGLARATSDHAFNATIWDVAVLPSLQGLGLGKVLLYARRCH